MNKVVPIYALLGCGLALAMLGCTPPPSSEKTSPLNSAARHERQDRAQQASPLDGSLVSYSVIRTDTVDWPGHESRKVWFVSRNTGVFGVFVEVDERPVLMRATDEQDGLPGPEEGHLGQPKLVAKDLDGDGEAEFVLTGVGGRSDGLWVYRYNPQTRTFQYMGDMSGLAVRVVDRADGPVIIEVYSRNHDKQVTLRNDYKWQNGTFVRVGEPLIVND